MDFIIDDGRKEYVIKNKKGIVISKIYINPTDTSVITKFDDVKKAIKKYDVKSDSVEAEIINAEKFIKNKIDYIFGAGTADHMFFLYGPLALMEDGEFFINKVFDIVGKIITSETESRFEAKINRIKAMTEKNRT